MSFKDTLWNLVLEHKALYLCKDKQPEGQKAVHFLVPAGRYAGVWTFKSFKSPNEPKTYRTLYSALSWDQFSMQLSRNVRARNQKCPSTGRFTPFYPPCVYSLLGEQADKFHLAGKTYKDFIFVNGQEREIHPLHRPPHSKRYQWMNYHWTIVKNETVKPLLVLYQKLLEEYPLDNTQRQGLSFAFQFVHDLLEETANLRGLAEKCQIVCRLVPLLQKVGVDKRWKLLRRIFTIGPKKALKRTWPNMTARIRNDICHNHEILDSTYYSTTRWRQEVFQGQVDDISLASLISIWRHGLMNGGNASNFGAREEYKDYYYRVAKKYGEEGVNVFYQLCYELQGAALGDRGPNEPLFDPPNLNTSLQEAHRWHNRLAEERRAREERFFREQDRRFCQSLEIRQRSAEEQHRENWQKLSLPKVFEVKPLISKEEFDQEGKKMHHCIASYFYSTESLFAHVSLEGEEATLHARDNKIIQLYQACNKPVSPIMMRTVQGWLKELQ